MGRGKSKIRLGLIFSIFYLFIYLLLLNNASINFRSEFPKFILKKKAACHLLSDETFFFTFFYALKKKGNAKIFNIRFSMDLYVLRCPEHDLTIFRKCLSVCMSPKFCGHCIS